VVNTNISNCPVRTLVADEGLEANQKVAVLKPDLILLNIGLPGPKLRLLIKRRNLSGARLYRSPPATRHAEESKNGGAVKTIVTFFAVMLLSSVMFAQQRGGRAALGTTTTTNQGSCSSASSTTSTTSGASQRSQASNTARVVGTKSKAAALVEAIDAIHVSRSASLGTPSSGVELPSTIVPFR
jgi:hypothetical protein